MNQSSNSSRAFTLLEIMIVLVIISLVAGFVFPNYKRTQEKAFESTGYKTLQTLYKANRIYFVRNDQYWPTDGASHAVDEIMPNLHVDLVENGMTFSCTGDGAGYNCDAVRDGGGFTLTVEEDDTAPCCKAGACPSVGGC